MLPSHAARRFTKVAGLSRTGVDLDEAWLSHGGELSLLGTEACDVVSVRDASDKERDAYDEL